MIGRLKAPIILAHGLCGFSRIGFGPVTLASYFRGVPQALRAAGNRVLATRVHPTASVDFRGRRLGYRIDTYFPGEPVHVVAHSMGGLDARRLLALPGWRDRVLSLTTIATPHQGSILADFAKLRVGRIYRLLAAMGIDARGFQDVTRLSMRRFNRTYGPILDVPCFSIAGEPVPEHVSRPLRRLREALAEMQGPNDGLVPSSSAVAFGEPLDPWPLDHLRQMNWFSRARDESDPFFVPSFYGRIVANLIARGFGVDDEEAPVPSVSLAR